MLSASLSRRAGRFDEAAAALPLVAQRIVAPDLPARLRLVVLGDEGLRRIRKVRKLQENNARLRYLSAEECQTLIAACDPHLRPVIVTAINSGMRREEILSLEWEKHIDMKHGFILLDRTKNGDRREIPVADAVLIPPGASPHAFGQYVHEKFSHAQTLAYYNAFGTMNNTYNGTVKPNMPARRTFGNTWIALLYSRTLAL